MAARDYPPENPDDPRFDPGTARAREFGVPQPDAMTVFQRVMKWARWILTALTAIYCVSYLAILYGLEFHAEDHQFLSTMMYAPPWAWLLPIIPLGVLAIFIYARLLIPLALMVPVMIFGFMDMHWHNHASALNPSFKIVTNNIGQDHKKSFKDFADLQKADIIALQDANASVRGPEFAKDYPDRYVVGKDQFILISKFPIRCGKVSHKTRAFILCTAITRHPWMRASLRQPPSMVRTLQPRLRATIFLPCNFTRKKARPLACSCTVIFCVGTHNQNS